MTKDELTELVQALLDASGSEEGQERLLSIFESSVPDPQASDLIYWPENHPKAPGRDLTAEEIEHATAVHSVLGASRS